MKTMNTQDAKNDILARIRSGRPASIPLPDVPMYSYSGNPVDGFLSQLLSFDGRAVRFRTRQDAVDWLSGQPETDPKVAVYSSAEGVKGNVSEADLTDLHNAHTIETCVTESPMGVGEMGSVWVTDDSLVHAACALLSRRLFVFLDAGRIVGGLHQAYASLRLGDHQYGSFYTGPSATADIEAVRFVGPIDPATKRGFCGLRAVNASAAQRASRAASCEISRAYPSNP